MGVHVVNFSFCLLHDTNVNTCLYQLTDFYGGGCYPIDYYLVMLEIKMYSISSHKQCTDYHVIAIKICYVHVDGAVTRVSVPKFMVEWLPTVPNCNVCGFRSGKTEISATCAKVGVILVVVLPESHKVQALNPPMDTNVAKHSLSSWAIIGCGQVVLDIFTWAFLSLTSQTTVPLFVKVAIVSLQWSPTSNMGVRNLVSVSRS